MGHGRLAMTPGRLAGKKGTVKKKSRKNSHFYNIGY
jgi:hypothetical protein